MNLRMLSPELDIDLLPQLSDLAALAAEDGDAVHFDGEVDIRQRLAYWQDLQDCMTRGKLAVLGAIGDDGLIGSVMMCLDTPPAQRHCTRLRAMLVRPAMQKRGIGSAMLAVAEAEARNLERWLMLSEAVSGSPAARMFTRAGWERVGDVPAMMAMPHGGLAPGTIYFKRL